MTDLDAIVVGAGLAGVTCAQQLQQAGCRVLTVEKARGVGGRATTRRLAETCVDRGLPFLTVQGEQTAQLMAELQATQQVQPWPTQAARAAAAGWQALTLPTSGAALQGSSAIAKHRARHLTVRCQYRVQRLQASDSGWQLVPDAANEPVLQARALVLAIPAPQARVLLAALAPARFPPLARTLGALAAVEFAPCLAVAAGYPATALAALPGQWLEFAGDRQLAQLSLESSKRPTAADILVAYSTSEFATPYLDTADLQPATDRLLSRAAAQLSLATPPLWTRPHRWRYALTRRPAGQPYLLASESPPLLCCGDWCLGDRVEDALVSGAAAATALQAQLAQCSDRD